MNNTLYTSSRIENTPINKTPTTSSWTISTINIQGLIDNSKRNIWFTYLSQFHIDIITHIKPNVKDLLTNKWQISGYSSWWHNDETQKIGSGIGISIKNHIAKHVYKIQTWFG